MFKQLVKDSAVYGFADFLLKILSFFTFPIFANLLSVKEYGIMSFALVISGFVGMFVNLGLNNSLHRFYFEEEDQLSGRAMLVSTGYLVLTCWSLSLTAIFILAAYIFKDFILLNYQLPFSYIALALLANVPAQLLAYSSDTIRLHFNPFKFFILSLCRNFAGIILAIILMYYYQLGLWGYFLANFVGAMVFIPLGLFLTKSECKLIFDWSTAKKLVKFGYPFIFAGLAYWLFGSMDRWMLGEWSTMEEAGLYSIAFKIGSVILFVNTAFGQAWSPVAIKVMNENPSDYKSLFSQLFVYWFALLVVLGSIASLFVAEFLMITTPEEYWGAKQSSVWITMGLVISGTTQLTALGISISKKTKYFTLIAWITTGINFGLNYWLIPDYGALGSAVATFFTYLVLSSSYLFISQKLHPLPYQFKQIGILLFFLFFTIAICSWFNNLFWQWNLVFYKAIWVIFMIFVFLRVKIIDINNLLKIFNKESYEK